MNELSSSLPSNARDTWNIVCAVAGQGENFPNLRRFNAPLFLNLPRAEEGETLRDVAIRVYGSPDATDTLWRLNRDLVGRRDAPLPSGTFISRWIPRRIVR